MNHFPNFATIFLLLLLGSAPTNSFTLFHRSFSNTPSTQLSVTGSNTNFALRRGIKLPILDVPDPEPGSVPEHHPLVVMPLPSDHLPDELRDLNIYGMELSRPVHKLIMEDAIQRAGSVPNSKPVYGHLAWKPSEDTLEGAIGCVSEIILHADGDSTSALMGGGVDQGSKLETDSQGNDLPKTIVSCGAFRFVIKEVIQTYPFPVAIVDELPDSTESAESKSSTVKDDDDEDEDDDDDDDYYDNMGPPEMMKELFKILQQYVDQKVEEAANQEISPLEQSILEDSAGGMVADPVSVEKTRAEQLAATLVTFRTSILDIAPTPGEGYFAIAFLAAEIVDLSNAVRRKMLTIVDGIERLRYVLKQVNDAAGMERARKMAKQITDTTDEGSKDLAVGTPELPPWSKQITKGMKVSYYWNEEWEWCDAEVIEDPVMVIDELLVTVRFVDDDEIHKLPFSPDEKARWRPAR